MTGWIKSQESFVSKKTIVVLSFVSCFVMATIYPTNFRRTVIVFFLLYKAEFILKIKHHSSKLYSLL